MTRFWLVLLTTLFLLAATGAEARKVALIIGNSDYANTSHLVNPANDIKLVAASARSAGFDDVTVAADLAVTVRDAGIGYVVGLAAAFCLAVVFCVSPVLERIVMPTAMVLRSIPLVVLTPLITLIFGIGQAGVTAIVILVVFLPALANILYGLRSVSGEAPASL